MDNFLQERRTSGQLESEGAFTVAPRLRYERLQDALEENPANFLLKVFQGFVGLGATAIDISVGRANVVITAKGVRQPGSLRDRLSSQQVGDLRDPLDDLAMGVLSGMRAGFPEVEWHMGGAESHVMSAGTNGIVASARPGNGFRVEFRMPLGQALRRIFQLARLRADLHCAVYDRCSYAPCKVTFSPYEVPAKNIGEMALGETVVVNYIRVVSKNTTRRMPQNGRYGYHYWGVLQLLSSIAAPTYKSPEMPGPAHCVADGSLVQMPPKCSYEWGVFLHLQAERAADGIVRRCAEPEGKTATATLLLLADGVTPGNLLVLLHRGVLLDVVPCELGSSRAVVIADASGLDLDASTLHVVHNHKLEHLQRELRKLTELLLREISSRQPYKPAGLDDSWNRLHT